MYILKGVEDKTVSLAYTPTYWKHIRQSTVYFNSCCIILLHFFGGVNQSVIDFELFLPIIDQLGHLFKYRDIFEPC